MYIRPFEQQITKDSMFSDYILPSSEHIVPITIICDCLTIRYKHIHFYKVHQRQQICTKTVLVPLSLTHSVVPASMFEFLQSFILRCIRTAPIFKFKVPSRWRPSAANTHKLSVKSISLKYLLGLAKCKPLLLIHSKQTRDS